MLPKEKTPTKKTIEEMTTLIYGAPKIGKSTLASQFDSPLFLATEAGLNSLEVYQLPCPDWKTFTDACAEIAAGKHNFKTVVIDTIDNAHKFCSEFIRAKHGMQHESDLEWGKGWNFVSEEFRRVLTKLSLLPYGLVMVSHADNVELKTRTAILNKAIPTLRKSAREIVLDMSDFILYCESIVTEDGDKRIMRTKPSENWEAGDRGGYLPPALPLEYEAFIKAFNEGVKKKGGK